MQQSYVCALIAMMVRVTSMSYETTLRHYDPAAVSQHHSGLMLIFFIRPGLEHHVPQLVDVRAAAVGLSHLDPACKVTAGTCCTKAVRERICVFKALGAMHSTDEQLGNLRQHWANRCHGG